MPQIETVLVAGVGDATLDGQAQPRHEASLVPIYRRLGLNIHPYFMVWADGQPYDEKRAELHQYIVDNNITYGVGYSAGGGALVSEIAWYPDSLRAVTTICSKLANIDVEDCDTPDYPAYGQMLTSLPEAWSCLSKEERRHIMNLRPLSDKRVPPSDALMLDCVNERVTNFGPIPTFGHSISIALFLLLGARRVAGFAEEHHKS